MPLKKKNIQSSNIKPAKNVSADILIPRLVFIVSVIALVLFGLVMVFSASCAEALNNNESAYSYLLKQGFFCVIGLGGAYVLWRVIPFNIWRTEKTWWLFGIMFVLMLATLFAGKDILGARRWIYIGGMSFQPAEFAKIALVLLVAKLYADYKAGVMSRTRFYGTCVTSVVVMLGFIVLGQSDLGTTIICTVGVLAVLWIAGAPKKFIVGLIILIVLFGIGFVVFSSYRSSRFQFLDPYNDGYNGYGAGYQIIRSYYALAEGGIAGMGLGNSFEKFQYLPEAETDFIFAIIGEELGLIGATFVIVLFLVFLISGLFISLNSRTRFSASVSGALVVMIVFQAMVNIACVVGFFPTTGKPLPFISSGGSSLMASLVMVGLILAASEDDSKPDVYEQRRSKFKGVDVGGWIKGNSEKILSKIDKPSNTQVQTNTKTMKGVLGKNQKESKPNTKKKNNQFAKSNIINIPKFNRNIANNKQIKQPDFIDKNNNRRKQTSSTLRKSQDRNMMSDKQNVGRTRPSVNTTGSLQNRPRFNVREGSRSKVISRSKRAYNSRKGRL